jgi:hypothetical protein
MTIGFQKLGETVDLSEMNLERARRFVEQPALEEVITVHIPKSNFGDGSQQVANALTKVLLSHLEDTLAEALALLEDEADDARKAMAAAFTAPKDQPEAVRAPKQKARA